jgi:hypothetical protein
VLTLGPIVYVEGDFARSASDLVRL